MLGSISTRHEPAANTQRLVNNGTTSDLRISLGFVASPRERTAGGPLCYGCAVRRFRLPGRFGPYERPGGNALSGELLGCRYNFLNHQPRGEETTKPSRPIGHQPRQLSC